MKDDQPAQVHTPPKREITVHHLRHRDGREILLTHQDGHVRWSHNLGSQGAWGPSHDAATTLDDFLDDLRESGYSDVHTHDAEIDAALHLQGATRAGAPGTTPPAQP